MKGQPADPALKRWVLLIRILDMQIEPHLCCCVPNIKYVYIWGLRGKEGRTLVNVTTCIVLRALFFLMFISMLKRLEFLVPKEIHSPQETATI